MPYYEPLNDGFNASRRPKPMTLNDTMIIEKMLEDGVDTFYEIGPGKTLAGFMKRIDRSKKVISISTVEELNSLG